jgi:hypothetical protein
MYSPNKFPVVEYLYFCIYKGDFAGESIKGTLMRERERESVCVRERERGERERERLVPP